MAGNKVTNEVADLEIIQRSKRNLDAFLEADDQFPTIASLSIDEDDSDVYTNEQHVPQPRHLSGIDPEVEQQLQRELKLT